MGRWFKETHVENDDGSTSVVKSEPTRLQKVKDRISHHLAARREAKQAYRESYQQQRIESMRQAAVQRAKYEAKRYERGRLARAADTISNFSTAVAMSVPQSRRRSGGPRSLDDMVMGRTMGGRGGKARSLDDMVLGGFGGSSYSNQRPRYKTVYVKKKVRR